MKMTEVRGTRQIGALVAGLFGLGSQSGRAPNVAGSSADVAATDRLREAVRPLLTHAPGAADFDARLHLQVLRVIVESRAGDELCRLARARAVGLAAHLRGEYDGPDNSNALQQFTQDGIAFRATVERLVGEGYLRRLIEWLAIDTAQSEMARDRADEVVTRRHASLAAHMSEG